MMHVSRSVVVIGLKLNLLLKLLRKPQHKALHYRYYDVCNCTIKLLKQEPPERVDFCCLDRAAFANYSKGWGVSDLQCIANVVYLYKTAMEKKLK